MKCVLQNVLLSDIVPYDNNPRDNSTAIDKVAKSIQDFGFNNPILLDSNNIIVAGHTRYEAAKKLGLKEVPCIYLRDLSDKKIQAFRIADNKTSEYATWDFEKLNEELESLIECIDMTEYGFTKIELDLIDEIASEIEETEQEEEKPKAKLLCPHCSYIGEQGDFLKC